eukprot:12769879-Ditylum_brightwellii.AAC.1
MPSTDKPSPAAATAAAKNNTESSNSTTTVHRSIICGGNTSLSSASFDSFPDADLLSIPDKSTSKPKTARKHLFSELHCSSSQEAVDIL